ncbi:MAG: DUF3606 domain-containing protein [Gammaproteobacteria bacterium]|nr:DUF3606 domain-containing protein [Gammaproteobacteria bacterium]MBU1444093.1 DUF3606 domain-containing protein [Gammaproteobacteria bacterium]MBU2287106.1 DUF3606 domain-containing protein [Gammaproteobacteria bacterium]MBU2410812.1 DUF3606 domain-containing protein [Gammaproteobacteria bacterium]
MQVANQSIIAIDRTAQRAQVNVVEDAEINYWTSALGVTEDALRRAVANAGTVPADVRDYLGVKPSIPMAGGSWGTAQ